MKEKNEKVLVVAAHPDDELLGVAGTLLRHVREGDDVTLLIMGDGETSRDEGENVQKRSMLANNVAKGIRAKECFLEFFPDNKFDTCSLLSIVKVIEQHLSHINPTVIYTHHRHDLNVDHRITFQAVLTACRPIPGSVVKRILTFETVSATEWQVSSGEYAFCPNVYVDISGEIERKLELLELYKDEIRPYPHPRSYEGVKILAQKRGTEVGYNFAEAFELIRERIT